MYLFIGLLVFCSHPKSSLSAEEEKENTVSKPLRLVYTFWYFLSLEENRIGLYIFRVIYI